MTIIGGTTYKRKAWQTKTAQPNPPLTPAIVPRPARVAATVSTAMHPQGSRADAPTAKSSSAPARSTEIIKRLLDDGLIIERRERPAVHDDEAADITG